MARLLMLTLASLAAGCGDNKLARRDAEHDDAPEGLAECVPRSGSTLSARLLPGQVNGIATHSTSPPNDSRLFVIERESRVRVFINEVLQDEPFLDLSGLVALDQTVERGLLGMAFHPAYAQNGQFFVFYTTDEHSVVARCTVTDENPDRADDTCVPILKALHDSAGNHNGGMVEFGNDGYLYIGTGDGGGAGDPNRRAQDPNDLLGKILRIDVDTRAPGLEYGIPPGNPYANGGGRPEVFIRGVRNPWRFSFDRLTGDLWIGDVGQNRWEEMNVLRPAQQAGANLGWSMYEGPGCCATQSDLCLQAAGTGIPCDPTGMFFAQDARDRTTPRGDGWAAVVAGQTYRGTCYPDLVGWHIYTDFYRGTMVKARLLPDDTLELHDLPNLVYQVSSIHADSRGELYMTDVTGHVYHLEAGP